MSVLAYSGLDSAPRTDRGIAQETPAHFIASRDLLDAGSRFETHLHQEDQLAWTASGSVDLDTLGERWHLRSEHLTWIPAGTMHQMTFPEPTELVSLYLDPLLRPAGNWDEPRTMRADQLAVALMRHLTEGVPAPVRRAHCRRLLLDLLAELPVVRDIVSLPRDPRAREVAARLLDDPADHRELESWAAELGVSAKTLARAFAAGTGTTFRQWRVNARLHAATRLLSDGTSVQDAAFAVGYLSVSSFITAFRSRFGVTPARYADAIVWRA